MIHHTVHAHHSTCQCLPVWTIIYDQFWWPLLTITRHHYWDNQHEVIIIDDCFFSTIQKPWKTGTVLLAININQPHSCEASTNMLEHIQFKPKNIRTQKHWLLESLTGTSQASGFPSGWRASSAPSVVRNRYGLDSLGRSFSHSLFLMFGQLRATDAARRHIPGSMPLFVCCTIMILGDNIIIVGMSMSNNTKKTQHMFIYFRIHPHICWLYGMCSRIVPGWLYI